MFHFLKPAWGKRNAGRTEEYEQGRGKENLRKRAQRSQDLFPTMVDEIQVRDAGRRNLKGSGKEAAGPRGH